MFPLSSSININDFPHLQGLEFADEFDGSQDCINLLVGADKYFQIVSGDTIRGESENGPVPMSSKLGWLLVGPVSNSESDVSDCIYNLVIEGNSSYDARKNEDQELVQTLKRFWEIEHYGVEDNLDKHTNEFYGCLQGNETNASFSGQKKQVCSNHFDAQFKGKRYEVGLPWRDDLVCDPISSDYRLCRDRLKSLCVKLKGKPELMAEYDAIFREQFHAGIIEQVPVSRENEVGVHFMPHHSIVCKDGKTSKLRIVFDGSAKQNADEFSLNEHLDEGPNYIPSLFDVLVKFRVHPVALTVDVEKAFLQIQIKPDDRDMFRFLWFDDVNSPDLCIVQFRFRRLPFGLPPSPSILGGTVRKHLENYQESHPDIVEILKELYVNNLSSSVDTTKKALDIIYMWVPRKS